MLKIPVLGFSASNLSVNGETALWRKITMFFAVTGYPVPEKL